MANLFQRTAKMARGSSFVLLVFIAALVMSVIGGIFSAEDGWSGYYGVVKLEQAFTIQPTIMPITYIALAIAPQAAQIVFSYLFLAAESRKERLIYAGIWLVFFAFDFVSDLEYRSTGLMSNWMIGAQTWEQAKAALGVAAGLTFFSFTIGSEMFLSFGLGLVLELFADFKQQAKKLYKQVTNNGNYDVLQQVAAQERRSNDRGRNG